MFSPEALVYKPCGPSRPGLTTMQPSANPDKALKRRPPTPAAGGSASCLIVLLKSEDEAVALRQWDDGRKVPSIDQAETLDLRNILLLFASLHGDQRRIATAPESRHIATSMQALGRRERSLKERMVGQAFRSWSSAGHRLGFSRDAKLAQNFLFIYRKFTFYTNLPKKHSNFGRMPKTIFNVRWITRSAHWLLRLLGLGKGFIICLRWHVVGCHPFMMLLSCSGRQGTPVRVSSHPMDLPLLVLIPVLGRVHS